MNNLVDFANRVKEQLSRVDREPYWSHDEAIRYMADVATRRERFEKQADQLIEGVIRPRCEVLASWFPNATPAKQQPSGCCIYWFGYCERFPASTRLTISVEHDVRFENLFVCYEAFMTPLFIKLNERDKITLSIDDVNEEAIASWVERRLLEFLDAYLRLDRGSADFADEAVTDPVCGMRISRSAAAASDTYRGHPYFFCSQECKQRFSQSPQKYVEVETM